MYLSEGMRGAEWWGARAGARLGSNTQALSRLPEQKWDTMYATLCSWLCGGYILSYCGKRPKPLTSFLSEL